VGGFLSVRRTPVAGSSPYVVLRSFALLAILYFTLFPFDFQLRGQTVGDVLERFDMRGHGEVLYDDLFLNVILFLPFGFALAGSLSTAARTRVGVRSIALLACLICSASVEFVQGYALLRDTAGLDVLANSIGGGLGVMLFEHSGASITDRSIREIRRAKSSFTLSRLVLAYALFFVLFVIGSVFGNSSTKLDNWDPSMPLVIGNETTGDRPWRGSMAGFYVIDRSISDLDVQRLLENGGGADSATSYVARHDFSEAGFPALAWNDGQLLSASPQGVHLDESNWLESVDSVAELSASLDGSSEFTVGLLVAADDLDQHGPARLISISNGLFQRNLTVAQDGSSLVVRIRTALTGVDAIPEFAFSDVFADRASRHIVVRYDGSSIRLDVDDSHDTRVLDLGPEAASLLATFPYDVERVDANPQSRWIIRGLHRAVAFVPWAGIMVWRRRRSRSMNFLVASIAGLLVAAAAYEVAMTSLIEGYDFRPSMVGFDMVIIALAMSLFRTRTLSATLG
jgi:glycopeptide antibiotics resistance protein